MLAGVPAFAAMTSATDRTPTGCETMQFYGMPTTRRPSAGPTASMLRAAYRLSVKLPEPLALVSRTLWRLPRTTT
jgi:hypothetical protein